MNATIYNLEQVRAAHALEAIKSLKYCGSGKDEEDGDHLRGYHSCIITNGLLATFAFSLDKKGDRLTIAKQLVRHIAKLQKDKLFPGTPQIPEDVQAAIGYIAQRDTGMLAMITAECMAYLSYLKRFVRAEKNSKD